MFLFPSSKLKTKTNSCTIWGSHSRGYEVYSWDITPCSPLRVTQRFGGTHRLYLQDPRISRSRNKFERRFEKLRILALLVTCFHNGVLLDLFFYSEDGDDMFLRNDGWLSMDYTTLCPRIQYSSKIKTASKTTDNLRRFCHRMLNALAYEINHTVFLQTWLALTLYKRNVKPSNEDSSVRAVSSFCST
jgi:hypothetical protein